MNPSTESRVKSVVGRLLKSVFFLALATFVGTTITLATLELHDRLILKRHLKGIHETLSAVAKHTGTKPKFDPSKPFTELSGEKSAFDPDAFLAEYCIREVLQKRDDYDCDWKNRHVAAALGAMWSRPGDFVDRRPIVPNEVLIALAFTLITFAAWKWVMWLIWGRSGETGR